MTGSRIAWRKTGVLESPAAASADVCFLFKARLMCPAHLYRSILKAPFWFIAALPQLSEQVVTSQCLVLKK